MWMKVDDGLHAHRKTRAVTKSHPSKTRDAAPMGLWVLAGSWAAQNRTDGWVPEDELDRFDQDWHGLVSRLVASGYWWPADRDGERGYGFNDWLDYNPESEAASRSGSFGNHVRWHEHKGVVNVDCDHCPKEPDRPESGGDIGGRSGGESGWESRNVALPVPDPTRPDPNPSPEPLLADEPADTDDRFDEFWNVYGKKVKRADAEKKWAKAIRKASPDRIIAAAHAYVAWERANNQGGRFIADPSTWLHGERWNDERPTASQPTTRVQEHLSLVQRLAAEENDHPTIPQIGGGR